MSADYPWRDVAHSWRAALLLALFRYEETLQHHYVYRSRCGQWIVTDWPYKGPRGWFTTPYRVESA